VLTVELGAVVALVSSFKVVKVEEVVDVVKRALDYRPSLEHEPRCIFNQYIRVLHSYDLTDLNLKSDHTVVINVPGLALISQLQTSFAKIEFPQRLFLRVIF
jgi:hypothetical protein